MEEDYEKFLKSKKVVELKNIARSYIKHIKFAFTGVKKGELVNHLLKHTMLEDGKIKVIDSVVPVKVLIKGRSEDSVKKMIDDDELKLREKERLQRLLYGQKGQFSGRIQRLQSERDELIREDEDNLRKKHTKAIEDYNKQIEETKKQLKVVNALIADYKKKNEERKAKKEEPKKEEENMNKLIDIEKNDFETREETKIRIEREDKEYKQRQLSQLINLFKSYADKDDWKKSTKIEKELLCSNYSTFEKLGFKIPDHLVKYHKNWCKKKK
jgi:hypothetical protein